MVAQSLKVAQVASTMFGKMRQIRDMERTKHILRLYGKANESNMLDKINELANSDDEHAKICKTYLTLNSQMRLEKRIAQIDTLWAVAYENAQPEAHTVEISPLSYTEPEENPDDPIQQPDDPTVEPGTTDEIPNPNIPTDTKTNFWYYIGALAVVAIVSTVVLIKKKQS